MISQALQKIIQGNDLSAEEARQAMTAIMLGEAGDIGTAALLAALAVKGETGEEIQSFARSMRKAAEPWPGPDVPVLADTCGTGGDSQGTLNISTIAAILLASMGVPVAKHGNRAVSSKSGSADLLEQLGVRLDLEPREVAQCLERVGICFLFAQKWHPAMKYAAPVRKAMGVRTVFNLLGPLTNPAPVTHQVLGVFGHRFVEPIAEALAGLGRKGAYVVHSADGLDECSIADQTYFCRIESGAVVEKGVVTPEDFGFRRAPLESLRVADAQAARERSLAVLGGRGSEIENHVIAMNAALLYSMTAETTLPKAADACLEALRSGGAEALVGRWKAFLYEGSGSDVVSLGH